MSTGVMLPVAVGGSAAGWRLVDYLAVRRRTAPAQHGVAMVDLGQLDPDELWLVDHAVVSSTSSTPTTVRWYESTVSDMTLIDGTAVGDFDVADWPNGLRVHPSQSLVVVWSGASDGAIGAVSVQVRVLRR